MPIEILRIEDKDKNGPYFDNYKGTSPLEWDHYLRYVSDNRPSPLDDFGDIENYSEYFFGFAKKQD